MKHQILKRYPIGNPRRLWQQENFVLSTFSVRGKNMRDALENCADAGFNMVELGWASHKEAEEALRICEELRLPLLFQDFSECGGMQAHRLDRVVTKEKMKAFCDHLRPWNCLAGWYVWDEPYHDDQLAEARRQADLYQREMPDKLPFTVAIPSYNNDFRWENGEFAGYLHRYAQVIDPPVLSLDFYPIGLPGYEKEKQLDKSYFWCDLAQMREVGRAYDLPLWFYYQALPMHGWKDFTFPMARMMMYASVLYGVKGLQQFTAVGSTILQNGKKGPFFEEQKRIHAEFAKLGNTLMALENRFVFHSQDLYDGTPAYAPFIDAISGSAVLADQPLPTRCSVGELADAYGNNYLLVLNRDFEKEQTFALPLKAQSHLYLVDRTDGRQHALSDASALTVTLAQGDAMLFRVQNADENACTVEYRIEK